MSTWIAVVVGILAWIVSFCACAYMDGRTDDPDESMAWRFAALIPPLGLFVGIWIWFNRAGADKKDSDYYR
jgi:membrane protein DedA with SNARE-associated domain